MTCDSALALIGATPLVTLGRIYNGPGTLAAKAEFLQPGGSVKDRAARAILESAKLSGRLKPSGLVVEMTSGNMGAGLAVACAVLGHPLVVTMSAGNSANRVRMLEALGAEVILVPQVSGTPGMVTGADIAAATEIAVKVADQRGGFHVDQFNALESIQTHEENTGPEIWEQSSGRVSAFVACVGSGGTFLGVSRALKTRNCKIICAAVEPVGCEVLACKPVHKDKHLLQGAGYGTLPPHWDASLMDKSIAVSDIEAEVWRHQLAVKEGLHVGFTAAANVCAATRLAQEIADEDSFIVTILCDSGLKY